MEINGQEVNQILNYADLNLSPEIMRAIEKKGFVQATPVQSGAIPFFVEWKDVIAITVQAPYLCGLKADGTVVTKNEALLPIVSQWKNVIAISGGDRHIAALLSDGTVVAAGDNIYSQCNVSGWKLF